MSLTIGLCFDLRSTYLAEGYSEEETAEFDKEDTIAALEDALGRFRELRHFLVRVHLEGVEACDAADAEHVPVVRFENAVLAGVGRVIPEIPALVLGGGLLYTLGAAVYALHRPNPWPATFGYHEVFHALVVGGVALHLAAVATLVAAT